MSATAPSNPEDHALITNFEILCSALAHGIEIETAHGVLSIRPTTTADRRTRPMLLAVTETATANYVHLSSLTVGDLIAIAENLTATQIAAARRLIATAPRVESGLAAPAAQAPLLRLAG